VRVIRPRHNASVHVVGELEVETYEAALGTRRRVRVVDAEPCRSCGGSGAGATHVLVCARCGGKGTLGVPASRGVGRWLRVAPCDECEGAGRFEPVCEPCGGTGRTSRERTVRVRIPAGIEDGASVPVVAESAATQLVVRIAPPPPDLHVVRYSAAAMLGLATAFLIFLVSQTT
jgi:molecular chaperone DnaJ